MKEVLTKILKKHKWFFIFQIILVFINIYLLTIPPKIIGSIVDLLYNIEQNKAIITQQLVYLLGLTIVLLIVRVAWKYLEIYGQRGCEKELINKTFERMLKVKIEQLQNIKNGEIMSYFVKDINEIRSAIYRVFSHGSRIVIIFIITTYSMIRDVNLKLTIFTLLPMFITTFIVIKLKKQLEKSFRKAQINFTEMSEFVQESTDSIRTTKAYSCEGNQLKEFIRKNKKLMNSNNTVDIFTNLILTLVNLCFGLCYGVSFLYGSKLVYDNVITVGEFVTFNGYITLYINPITWIPTLIAKIKRAQISYRRLDKFYKLEKEKNYISEKSNIECIKGDIRICNLTFNYPNFLDSALKNINIELKQGETLGIIGTLGSGKTTLMNLILKLYNIENNKIFIDGVDINDIPTEVIRNNICYITQDNFLFSTTLRNNISLFKDNYNDDEIIQSTKKAMIYDEISQMPDNIDTIIGERGVDLSGGQKQRVVISRAFLKRSSIVIFDDTFSALDNKTEETLLENIKELAQDKTCIIISNRISDVKNSNKIIVLENGEIIQSGTHETLLNEEGRYKEFYQKQITKTKEDILA